MYFGSIKLVSISMLHTFIFAMIFFAQVRPFLILRILLTKSLEAENSRITLGRKILILMNTSLVVPGALVHRWHRLEPPTG